MSNDDDHNEAADSIGRVHCTAAATSDSRNLTGRRRGVTYTV